MFQTIFHAGNRPLAKAQQAYTLITSWLPGYSLEHLINLSIFQVEWDWFPQGFFVSSVLVLNMKRKLSEKVKSDMKN